MKAKFIGTNGSMGFIKGMTCELSTSFNSYLYPIIVTAVDDKDAGTRIPYNSLKLLFENWEFESIVDRTHVEIDYKTFKRVRCNEPAVDNNEMLKSEKYLAIAIILVIAFMTISKYLNP